MNAYRKLDAIQDIIREVRDYQKEIKCDPRAKTCICNEFDSVIDEVEDLKLKFKAEPNSGKLFAVHSLAFDYLERTIESYKDIIGHKKVKAEEIADWIRWWGNGGGMYSVEFVFTEALEKAETLNEFLDYIKDDLYVESGTAILFADIIIAMLDDLYKTEINRTIPI